MKKKTTLLILTAMLTMLFTVGVFAKTTTFYSGIEEISVVKKTTGVKFKKIKKNSVKVEWKSVTNAVKYQVQYSKSKSFKKSNIKVTNENSATINKLKKNTKYYFRVRAISSTGYKGKWSKVQQVRTKKFYKELVAVESSK